MNKNSKVITAMIGIVWSLGLLVGLKIGINYSFNQIERVEATDTGCHLIFEDGTGYYIEY